MCNVKKNYVYSFINLLLTNSSLCVVRYLQLWSYIFSSTTPFVVMHECALSLLLFTNGETGRMRCYSCWLKGKRSLLEEIWGLTHQVHCGTNLHCFFIKKKIYRILSYRQGTLCNKRLCIFVFEGHSAKYGSYTMMDLETNTVVDVQLVQVNEQKPLMQRPGKLEYFILNAKK